jgi:hypothetical protein
VAGAGAGAGAGGAHGSSSRGWIGESGGRKRAFRKVEETIGRYDESSSQRGSALYEKACKNVDLPAFCTCIAARRVD